MCSVLSLNVYLLKLLHQLINKHKLLQNEDKLDIKPKPAHLYLCHEIIIWFPLLFFSATEKLVLRARQFVDVKKDDGFASLHLAALNGHRQIAETLITLGQADVNITNNRRQTPLLLAVSQVNFN